MITTASEFVALRTSNDPALYRRATSDAAPEEVWLEIVEKYPEMRQWVVHNKTVPNRILRILASDDDPLVRYSVAVKRKTEPAVLERLALDHEEAVRIGVAHNRKTPLYILRRLADDHSESVATIARKRLAESS